METSGYTELFIAEAREHLGAAYATLGRLGAQSSRVSVLRELLRHAHSLKGMASAMGLGSMVELAHTLEDLLERLQRLPPQQVERHVVLVGQSLAWLGRMVSAVELEQGMAGRPAAEPVGAPDGAGSCAGPWRIELELARGPEICVRSTLAILEGLGTVGEVLYALPLLHEPDGSAPRLVLVVESDRSHAELELMLRSLAGVVGQSISPQPRSTDTRRGPQARGRWLRLRVDQIDGLERRALQLRLEQQKLLELLPQATGPLQQQGQRCQAALGELQVAMQELRLVTFASIAPRLQGVVSTLACDLGKEVQLQIDGGELRLDHLLLEALVDPLLHAMRNALDHGLEPAAERIAAGKPGRGKLRLEAEWRAQDLHVTLEDDGRGISIPELKRQAMARGLISPAQAQQLTQQEALMLCMLPGLSTARGVTSISGRGVGLDAVLQAVERLGGRIGLQSRPGAGTRLSLTVPAAASLA